MRIDTVKGGAYALTCTEACTVQAIRADAAFITILEADTAGQYSFVAPGEAVEVSDENAMVTQVLKPAALGMAGRSGIQSGGDVVLRNLMAEAAAFSGIVNANGGIHVPLAAGAETDTASVNRAYAMGMAQLVLMHQTRTYWLTSSCTATNGVTINHAAPGCYCEVLLGANGGTSLTLPTTGTVSGGDYSKILGYSIPFRHNGGAAGTWIKVSMLIGAGGEWTESLDVGMDGYRFRPVSGSAPSIARLVEVTLYYHEGYKSRVRELIGVGKPSGYVVRTTESSLNYDSNTNPCSAAYRLVITQSEISYTSELGAVVWLVMGGASGDTVVKLADIRGWDTYHTSVSPTLYLDVQAGEYGGRVHLESPTILNGIGNNTYVRYGLEPYQRSWITAETEVPYTEPELPSAS